MGRARASKNGKVARHLGNLGQARWVDRWLRSRASWITFIPDGNRWPASDRRSPTSTQIEAEKSSTSRQSNLVPSAHGSGLVFDHAARARVRQAITQSGDTRRRDLSRSLAESLTSMIAMLVPHGLIVAQETAAPPVAATTETSSRKRHVCKVGHRVRHRPHEPRRITRGRCGSAQPSPWRTSTG